MLILHLVGVLHQSITHGRLRRCYLDVRPLVATKPRRKSDSTSVLEIDCLTRRFGTKTAVAQASLQINDGEMVGIIGRSGAGKSTLLRLINRLIEPSDGHIRHQGREITTLKGAELRAWRARTAMIFQQFHLVSRLDVLTNVLTGRLNYMSGPRMLLKLFTETERALAIRALDRLGVADVALNRADALSGGQAAACGHRSCADAGAAHSFS